MSNILPAYLAIGVSEEKFWDSTPADLKPYVEAHKLLQKERDNEAWRNGMYVMNAFQVVLANVLGGKKSKAEYFSKPLLYSVEEENRELTEDEMKIERDKLLSMLMIMKDNFDRTNSNKADDGG